MEKYKSSISFKGNTDIGKHRTNNEDAFIAQQIWDDKHILAVAIDGVGGYEGGEVAAAIAQKTIVEYLENFPNGERLDLLKQAVVEANNKIVEERAAQPQFANMSCVLTACLVEVERKQINMVHVGDTRLYGYRGGELKKLSHDHSLVGYREEIGDLTEDEAMNHPQRNVIGRDVGSARHQVNDEDFLEAAIFQLLPDTTLLLCSDGLCDMLKTVEMVEVLQQKIPLNEKVQGLIEAANEKGGKDNVTVILIEYQNDEPVTEEILSNSGAEQTADTEKQNEANVSKQKKSRPVSQVIIIAALILALLLGLAGGWLIRDRLCNEQPVQETPSDSTQN
ncbi:MAG: protein phosphatase 2C domain-containing protein [Tannerella sp.]|jgi:serine/threonine protein phosphatase PrpC|nr:protein phosphatase 2C domain-containing protein [Tannerella sp.]